VEKVDSYGFNIDKRLSFKPIEWQRRVPEKGIAYRSEGFDTNHPMVKIGWARMASAPIWLQPRAA
jgi:hypothetical protein